MMSVSLCLPTSTRWRPLRVKRWANTSRWSATSFDGGRAKYCSSAWLCGVWCSRRTLRFGVHSHRHQKPPSAALAQAPCAVTEGILQSFPSALALFWAKKIPLTGIVFFACIMLCIQHIIKVNTFIMYRHLPRPLLNNGAGGRNRTGTPCGGGF